MFFKSVVNDYILGVGIGDGGTKITQVEYNELTEAFHSMPEREGYFYKLRTNLTWEEFENVSESDEVDDSEALEILLGGAQ